MSYEYNAAYAVVDASPGGIMVMNEAGLLNNPEQNFYFTVRY